LYIPIEKNTIILRNELSFSSDGENLWETGASVDFDDDKILAHVSAVCSAQHDHQPVGVTAVVEFAAGDVAARVRR